MTSISMPIGTGEIFEFNGIRYAEILRAGASFGQTGFISTESSSFQFGLLEQPDGYTEKPHYHPEIKRTISDLQELIVMQEGTLILRFYELNGEFIQEVYLHPGDAAVLVSGAHSYEAVGRAKAFILKQGPFQGAGGDKTYLDVK